VRLNPVLDRVYSPVPAAILHPSFLSQDEQARKEREERSDEPRYTGSMGVTVEMQNTGDPVVRADVIAAIEHVFADRPGDWRVSIVGSQASDRWEMTITGPNEFERSYTLEGTAGEHRPEVIRVILGKMAAMSRQS
jgi:hypothetical protein